jgi:zinc protease
VQNWPARVNAVTAEDVRAAAQKYLRPEAAATGYLEPLAAERS